ncbi:MAG: hypothetical protein NC396_07945 [Bacteroides sp.]|nr:hypothetical protein [Bacteroides sp.]MCM1086265.1 hypothetical protein [Bacteroides sp.]
MSARPFFVRALLAVLLAGMAACCPKPSETVSSLEPAPVFPAYGDGTSIPCNIAPLNFALPDTVKSAVVNISSSVAQKTLKLRKNVVFPIKTWKKLCSAAMQGKRDTLVLEITVLGQSGARTAYPPLRWILCPEPIDPYLTYRLLPSVEGAYSVGKGGYNVMELRERNLENFGERVLLSNASMRKNCFNCHVSPAGDASRMLVHLRSPSEGSLLFDGKDVSKIVPPDAAKALAGLPDSLRMPLNLVYPAWHPDGRWIALSTNIIGINGYTPEHQYVDILDSACNIVLYDTRGNRLVLDNALWTAAYEETWPAWSPDGKWLYFCRAPKMDPDTAARYPDWGERVQHIYFDLCRVGFDAEKGRFSDSVQTLLKAVPGCSYSMPRVHPDGRHVLLCRARFNSIPYHAQGDLLLIDVENTGQVKTIESQRNISINPAQVLNSPESESWHDWSANGRWVVFGSKRQNIHYELPYIAYFDGKDFGKPFLLPQKDGGFYHANLRLFNLPTFSCAASGVTPRQAAQGRQSPALEIEVR